MPCRRSRARACPRRGSARPRALRLSALRWWAEKIGKPSVIARESGSYGIPERQYVSRQSKARTVSSEQLTQIRDDHVRMSLALQREFGLRREECMKFSPSFADRGDRLVLKASWTKGGKTCPSDKTA